MNIWWHVIYWTVFFLCWLVLPVAQEYEMAGEFTPMGRLKRALKRHVRYYAIVFGAGLAVLIYLFFTGELTL